MSQLTVYTNYVDLGYTYTWQITGSSLFQCSEQIGQVFTHNIPDLYFSHANAAAFRTRAGANLTTRTEARGTTFVFTAPIEPGCNGTVVALQYCYQGREKDIGRDREVFILLLMSRSGFRVRVDNRITVETTSHEDICSVFPEDVEEVICCGSVTLEADQFRISPSNHTFGVVMRSIGTRLLAFSGTNTADTIGPLTGDSFELNDDNLLLSNGLMILRFITGIHSNLY